MNRRRVHILASVLGAVLSLIAAGVRADSAEYTQLLRDGVQEFGLGNFGEARLMFVRAHALNPTARTYRGLGLCDFELRHYVSAIEELEAALSDSRRPLTPELRTQVQPILERARQYVGRYQLQVPAGVSRLEVDGKPRPLPVDRELLLDPGEHTLLAIPDNGPAMKRELKVEVGARDALVFSPEKAAEPAVAPPVQLEAEPPLPLVAAPLTDPAPPPPAASKPRIFTWVAAGLTGAFGVGVLGFGLSAKAKNSTFRDQANMGMTPDPALKRSGQTMETLTNVSIVGCALSAAAAVSLYFIEGAKNTPETAEPAVQAGISPTGAYVSGRF